MFERILVATDLSEPSDCVVGALRGLKNLGCTEAVLVHCLNMTKPAMVAELKDFFRPALDLQAGILERQGFKTEVVVAPGVSHVEINRIAEEKQCSVVVVGSHGQTMSTQILLGGVASEVIHRAVKPVLILRLRLAEERGAALCSLAQFNPLGHVLFPTDFSANADAACRYLRQIAAAGVGEVTLLHVHDQTRIDKDRLEEFQRIDGRRLDDLKRELEKAGVSKVNIDLPYGSPVKEISARAQEDRYSWVVMGSQGLGYIDEIFLGSVSHNVARRARIPVMLVPLPR